jgi:hypothetical protein
VTLAVNWPDTGIGWVVAGVIVVVTIGVLAYLHVRDSNVRSIRIGLFMERERHDDRDDD